MESELIYRCKVLSIRKLRSYLTTLTFFNIRETKMQNLVWFIYSKPNVYVMIFY